MTRPAPSCFSEDNTRADGFSGHEIYAQMTGGKGTGSAQNAANQASELERALLEYIRWTLERDVRSAAFIETVRRPLRSARRPAAPDTAPSGRDAIVSAAATNED